MRAIDLCDHPSGCDSEGTEYIELANHWHDLLRCTAHLEHVERCDLCDEFPTAAGAGTYRPTAAEPYHVRRARSRQ